MQLAVGLFVSSCALPYNRHDSRRGGGTVDAGDLKSPVFGRPGSSPGPGTSQIVGLMWPRRKDTLGHQHLPKPDSVGEIDLQDVYGHSPDCCAADERRSLPLEMLFPIVMTRVEQAHHLAAVAIDARHVRPLVVVTGKTGQSEIVRVVGTAVLSGDDVIDLKREQIEFLR